MNEEKKPSFQRTAAALAVYDADREARKRLWDEIDSDAGVLAAQRVDKEAADKVREAFYKDTKEYNSRTNAYLIHPDESYLRDIVKRYQ